LLIKRLRGWRSAELSNLVIEWWRIPMLLNNRRLSRWAILLLVLCGCAPDPKAITAECEQRAASEGEQVVSDCIKEKVKAHGIAGLTGKLAGN
jgi:hypothetical protein